MTFEETKEYVEKNSKLDMTKFNRITDITKMLDFLNNEREGNMEKKAEREISEISKFLARITGRTMFFLNGR